VSILLAFWCLWPAACPAQTADTSVRAVSSPRTAVLLSLVPGGGQWYNRKYLKAVVVGGAALSLGVARHYESDRTVREDFSWWLVGLYIYNLLDAYVDAHLTGFDQEINADIVRPRPDTTNRQ
jgi:hypothetical protein